MVLLASLLLILVLLPATHALGAEIAVDSYTDDYEESFPDDMLGWTHTIGSQDNRILIVGTSIKDYDKPEVTSVTYNGVAMHRIAQKSGGSAPQVAGLWYLLDNELPAAGSYRVQIYMSADSDSTAGWSLSLYNVLQQPPEDKEEYQSAFSSDNIDPLARSVVTQTPGAWVVDVSAIGSVNGDIWPLNGQTQFTEVNVPPYGGWPSGHVMTGSYRKIDTPGVAYSYYGFHDDDEHCQFIQVLAAFAPAAGGGSTSYNVTASVAGSGGSVNPTSQSVTGGNSATIDIIPDTGWTIASIVDNGTSVPVSDPYVISSVNADHNVVVTFSAPNTNVVTASVGGGSGSVTPTSQQVADGESATVSITPEAGWSIASIVDNGSSMPIVTPYVIESVTQDHDVVVTFSNTPEPPPPGECIDIEDTPLDVTLRPAAPLVMFVIDDSGSMDWEVITTEANGLFEWNRYIFDNPGDNKDDNGNSDNYLSDWERTKWKSQWSGYNKLYYNPRVDYEPWPNMSDADTAQPRSNPYNASPTFPLDHEFVTIDGNVIYRGHYYTWNDVDDDRELDAGEQVYLVNFIDFNGDDIPESRFWFEYNDNNGNNIVDAGELSMVMEHSVPAALKTRTPDEDLQNFANWYTYYRKRYLSARAAIANVIDKAQGMKIGFYGINGTINQTVRPVKVSGVDESAELLETLYSTPIEDHMTPLRTGLEKVGKYFDQTDGDDGGIGESPYNSEEEGGGCQQAYVILMTDGYYNGGDPSVGNSDSGDGTPYQDSYSNTLADVAMYYYKRDLAPNLPDDVPTHSQDGASHQHLVTYGVGFGVQGTMDPEDYDLNNGPYPTWSNPSDGDGQKIDDMWHATVNGRGHFVATSNVQELASELLGFVSQIQMLNLSGASASINGDELYTRLGSDVKLLQSKYYSENWNGDILAFSVDPDTGAVIQPATWSAAWQLKAIAAAERKIATYNGVSGGIPFNFNSLTDHQKDLLDADWRSDDQVARNIVDYLKGDATNEKPNGTFRKRSWTIDDSEHPHNGETIASSKLGDIVSSSPVFKDGVVYVGSNAGMLHAFDAETGNELFAYVPNLVFDNLALLKDVTYTHHYYVDSTPILSHIDAGGMTRILVGGLGKGGKGYYALNVSGVDPAQGNVPSDETEAAAMVLWEYPKDTTPSAEVKDLGYSYSRPVVAPTNDGNHPWVVIFGNGYNSENGHSVLFILDAVTGSLVKRIDTEDGPCNGLSAPVTVDVDVDGKLDYVYAGDLLGNLWKFDLSDPDSSNWDVAYKDGSTPKPLFKTPNQPITTRPDVMYHCSQEGFMVLFGTGRYLDEDDPEDQSTQSIYGIWDYGDRIWDNSEEDDDSEYVGTRDGLSSSLTDTNLPGAASLLSQSLQAEVTVNDLDVRVLSDGLATWMVTTSDGTSCEDHGGTGVVCDPNGTGVHGDPVRTVGWVFDLPTAGERVVDDVMVRDGKLIVVTNIPEGSACESATSSWLMQIDACSGSRLTEAKFDINGDGTVDSDDLVEIPEDPNDPDGPTIKVVPSGIKYDVRLHSPAFLIKGQTEILYMSSSSGTIETVEQDVVDLGVTYWKMYRP